MSLFFTSAVLKIILTSGELVRKGCHKLLQNVAGVLQWRISTGLFLDPKGGSQKVTTVNIFVNLFNFILIN